jgi:hypothetical protein
MTMIRRPQMPMATRAPAAVQPTLCTRASILAGELATSRQRSRWQQSLQRQAARHHNRRRRSRHPSAMPADQHPIDNTAPQGSAQQPDAHEHVNDFCCAQAGRRHRGRACAGVPAASSLDIHKFQQQLAVRDISSGISRGGSNSRTREHWMQGGWQCGELVTIEQCSMLVCVMSAGNESKRGEGSVPAIGPSLCSMLI